MHIVQLNRQTVFMFCKVHFNTVRSYFKMMGLPILITLCIIIGAATADQRLEDANNKFSGGLFKQLVAAGKDGDNIFFSPLSVHAVLSMLHQGATGKSKQALESTLHLCSQTKTANQYHEIMSRLNSAQNITQEIANKVYIKQGLPIDPNFKNVVTNKFLAEVENIEFVPSSVAAKKINDWVKAKTKDKIPTLFGDDAFDAATRLVLVNAVYFKAGWLHAFDKKDTEQDKFQVTSGKEVNARMMQRTSRYLYKHDSNLKAKILELPYKNTQYSMLFVLPDDKEGIQQLGSKISDVDVVSLRPSAETKVYVRIPTFKIETSMGLNQILVQMGLESIFKGDLNGLIANNESLSVSAVLQKAFIEVNEEGSEAAAATGVIVGITSSVGGVPKIPEFIADHPFLIYLIATQDNNKASETSLILFQGRIQNPEG